MKTLLKLTLLTCLINSYTLAKAQLNEKFDDGDFLVNPVWATDSKGDWQVNSNKQLQSNNTTTNSIFAITTPSSLALATQWEFFVQLNFNTSSLNYIDFFLTASAANLQGETTTGYFVRVGNSADEISLYRKDGSNSTKIIDGEDGTSNKSNNQFYIKVIKDQNNNWTLYKKDVAAGGSYVVEGLAVDNTYSSSNYFGILIKQSTASFVQKHFIDNISIAPYSPDIEPPKVLSAVATSATMVDILFDEAVDTTLAQATTNYQANNNIGNPGSIMIDAGNPALVHLIFPGNFPNGVANNLSIKNISDMAGNVLQDTSVGFSFYTVQKYDVVIDEIFADPSPQVGLPDVEWIELKNVSRFAINLKDYKIADNTGVSAAMPSFILQPDSVVIVCSNSAATDLSIFGKVVTVTGFPSLNNTDETIKLIGSNGYLLHAVNYFDTWHEDETKKNGGWSLEMIDGKNPCLTKENWIASKNNAGGTPGKINSQNQVPSQLQLPKIVNAAVINPNTIELSFNASIDSVSAVNKAGYTFSSGAEITTIAAPGPIFNRVNITTAVPLEESRFYTLTVANLLSCIAQPIEKDTVQIIKTSVAVKGDLIINELLFDPKPNAYDFVEILNTSNKVIDANTLRLATRNSTGDLSAIRPLSNQPFYIFPNDYVVATADAANLKLNYFVKNPDKIIELAVPAISNTKGAIVVLNDSGEVIDEVAYLDAWHHILVDMPEGVSIERTRAGSPSQDSLNWHTAAQSVGYATPTYANSQAANFTSKSSVEIAPKTFSPDGDGIDDVAAINYKTDGPGYIGNVTIFSSNGVVVKKLVQNGIMGSSGQWLWNGLGDKNQALPASNYIVLTEIFNPDGRKKIFKKLLVLARRLN